ATPASTPTSRQAPVPSEKGGWHAVIGNARTMQAHLRTAAEQDIVALNAQGIMFGLNAANGVTLWATRIGAGPGNKVSRGFPAAVPTRAGNDNLLIPMDGGGLRLLEGATGRELWRSPAIGQVSSAVGLRLGNGTTVFVVDNEGRRLITIDGDSGKLLA